MRQTVCAFAICICALVSVNAAGAELPGESWRQMSSPGRVGVALGVLIGVRDVAWRLLAQDDRIPGEEVGHAVGSLTESISSITPTQLRDGIDAFYDDFRNRQIELGSAAYLVIRSIKGMPQKDYDTLVEKFRRSSK